MKFFCYEEIEPGRGHPKLADHISDKEYAEKKTIVSYLRSGHIRMTRASRARDIFTDKLIPDEFHVMYDDDDYWWTSILAWYVEQYNLRLPEEFESHILKKAKENKGKSKVRYHLYYQMEEGYVYLYYPEGNVYARGMVMVAEKGKGKIIERSSGDPTGIYARHVIIGAEPGSQHGTVEWNCNRSAF